MGIMVGGRWGVELERKEGREKRTCNGGWGERKLIKWSEWNWREIFYIIDIIDYRGDVLILLEFEKDDNLKR